jgi:hypothetical protein
MSRGESKSVLEITSHSMIKKFCSLTTPSVTCNVAIDQRLLRFESKEFSVNISIQKLVTGEFTKSNEVIFNDFQMNGLRGAYRGEPLIDILQS